MWIKGVHGLETILSPWWYVLICDRWYLLLHLWCGAAQRKHLLLALDWHFVACDLTTDKILIPANIDIPIGPWLFQIMDFELLNLFFNQLNISFQAQFLHEQALDFGWSFARGNLHFTLNLSLYLYYIKTSFTPYLLILLHIYLSLPFIYLTTMTLKILYQ